MNDQPLYIGIDVGGTNTKAGLVDPGTGLIHDSHVVPTERYNSELFLRNIADSIDHFRKNAAVQGRVIGGLGIGVPSFVHKGGIVDSTYGFLEFMEDYPLAELIRKNNLQCKVDNDARVVALGEALFGAGKNYNRVLVLTLGTGLGIGFVKGGRLEDDLPYGHMSGHLTISESSVKCYCGKTGCLEALVSGTGILNIAGEQGYTISSGQLLTPETLFNNAHAGDRSAQKVIDRFLNFLRIGMDNYMDLFAPDLIVLGGGVSKGLKDYLPRLTSSWFAKPYKNYKPEVVTSSLTDQAGVLGAAALASFS